MLKLSHSSLYCIITLNYVQKLVIISYHFFKVNTFSKINSNFKKYCFRNNSKTFFVMKKKLKKLIRYEIFALFLEFFHIINHSVQLNFDNFSKIIFEVIVLSL
jgi:hypothetical protein